MGREVAPNVLALFASPVRAGRPESGDFSHGQGGSVRAGSLIELWLRAQDERIVDARFEAFGCPATIACGEWLCHWLIGRTRAEAGRLTGLDLAEALDLPAAKRAVALRAEDALKAALVGRQS